MSRPETQARLNSPRSPETRSMRSERLLHPTARSFDPTRRDRHTTRLRTGQVRHNRLGQTGQMRRQRRLGGSSPGHATAIGAEDSHWQGYLLSPDFPLSSGEGA